MVLKATANDKRHLALCHDEYRGPRSGLCRSGESSISFPEEDKTMSYSGFEPELTRLQAEGHIHLTGWVIPVLLTDSERLHGKERCTILD
ncbi:hypothetical protein TNCV_1180571 [Trichonephila clavipes]|nr:hypothetical protein TNCV_1180571 [Trichonephila clavipes]